MGYLAHILVVLLIEGAAEIGYALDLEAPALVPLVLVLPHVVAWIAQRLYLRGMFRASSVALTVLQWIAPLTQLVFACVLGWHTSIERWLDVDASLLGWAWPSVLLLFAPYALTEVLAIDARARVTTSRSERSHWIGFQLRMFGASLAPICAYVAISSLVGLSPTLRASIEEVALFHAIFAAIMVTLLAVFLPYILKNTWETEPVPPGPQRQLLHAVAKLASFGNPDLRVWKTGHSMANAAIIGVTPRTRVVLFSDLLLAEMRPQELAAVFAHEIGHARRWHVPIFLVWLLVFFLGADLLAMRFFPEEPWGAFAIFAAAVGLWYASAGYLSRRFELEADLFSLDLLGETHSLISALERVGGRLRDVASWRHFSTRERVTFLENVDRDPQVGAKLRRDLRRWTLVGVVLGALVLALQAQALRSALPADLVRVDLRLGRYASAVQRARHVPNLDPKLARLVARAGTYRETALGASYDLYVRSRESAGGAESSESLDWLELAAMRGERWALKELEHKSRRPSETSDGANARQN